MSREWTNEQKEAIEARKGTLLVSAAAGSGKTAVLTQRIIESILDRDDPVDITDLLVVTYTRAAAAELKSRIGDAIRDRLAEDPSDKRLRRQQIGLERAEISTIHSFCYQLIGEGAVGLGLPAGLRIADSAESKLLMRSVIDRLLEEEYRKADPSFMKLTDNFVTAGDGRFAEKLLDLYGKSCAMPEGVGIFAIYAEQLAQTDRRSFLDGAFGRLLLREVGYFAAHYEAEYRNAIEALKSEPLYAKTLSAFECEYPFLERLCQPFDDFDSLCGYISAFQTVARLPAVKSADKSPAYEEATAMRARFKKDLAKLRDSYFGSLLETFDQDTERSASLARALARLLERYDRLLSEEKLRKGILDFTDLERYTHKLLVKDGQPTEYARSVAARYRQIYIDEYQDVNRIQDEIFSAIARDNRFMVGDIKQSIYGFRGAEPSIFADYRRRFADETDEAGRLIFLSRNFRCDQSVIELTNAVCRKLFPSRSAEVPYQKGDELVYGKKSEKTALPAQIALISSAEKGEGEEESDPEAEYVARTIEKLVREEGYRTDEIAILLRSARSSAPIYERALAKRGIASASSVERPFFEEPEILLILSVLGAIDNPRQDVYLAGALMSPVFGFTLSDLLERFKVREGECLYELLRAAEGDERLTAFLEWLEDCRAQSCRLASDEMIRLVYRSTDLPAIVGADQKRGREAAANLNRFYELSRSYERSGFMGLHRFLRFVSDSAESGEAVKSETGSSSGVRIMTIHQSKGLEFPVCFLSETMKSVNLSDSKEQILFDKEMGMAFSLRDDSGFVHYNTLLRKMLAKKLTDSALEEEMRVLYVALTRAKERLYITAKAKDPEKVRSECARLRQNYSAFAVGQYPDYFHWIVGGLEEGSGCCQLIAPALGEAVAVSASEAIAEEGGNSAAVSGQEGAEELFDRLQARMAYRYPARALQDLPAKLTVSTLRPDFLDESSEMQSEAVKMVEKPSFMQSSDETAPSGAERGTATHVFMQFCDFDSVEQIGISGELARLVGRGFMSAAMAELVYHEALEAFFASPLYREMRISKLLRREFRFNVRLPATAFTQDPTYAELLSDTSLLVQGVIDCFFEREDGTLKLIDYKTDRLGRSPSETSALLFERYADQLRYYCMALEALTGKKVGEVALYSFWQSQSFSYPTLLTVNTGDTNRS